MGIFDKMNEPIFLKESNQAEMHLTRLREIEAILNTYGQALIRQDIKYLEYGIIGEKNIAFELKNSHMPMYILQDIYLEDGDLSAQIDFLVFTRKICFIIECKNLYGDIEINASGDFIRTIEFNGKKKKEGIYSPVTQNQRHLELMKKIKISKQKNIIMKAMSERLFDNFNKSIVVLANPKTVLDTKFTKKEMKEKVIRADQLVNHIKKTYNASKEAESSDTQLLQWAESYLKLHQEIAKDYSLKYKQYMAENIQKQEDISIQELTGSMTAETELFQELKQYRLVKSREEKVKPYFIYNNSQLEELINKMPKTLAELQMVQGFGEVKANKYGNDILQIVNKYI